MEIPKIIHQIWSDKYQSLPFFFEELATTWRVRHADWQYIYWDDKKMNLFLKEEYPNLCDFYFSLPFDMQRWDAIRFLILNKMGGVYVDFDYECIENIEPLLKNRKCCIASEPESHCKIYDTQCFINSALLATIPNHPFIVKMIEGIFSLETINFKQNHKPLHILNTTGPLKVLKIYKALPEEQKQSIYLIPAKYVTPFDVNQIRRIKNGILDEELEKCLDEAYAVHYFTNMWIPDLSEQKK